MTYSSVKVGSHWELQDTNGVVYQKFSDQSHSDVQAAQANFNDARGGVPLVQPAHLIAYSRQR